MPPPHPTPNHKSFQFAPPFLEKYDQFPTNSTLNPLNTPNTPNNTNPTNLTESDFSGPQRVQTRTRSGRNATRFEMEPTATSTSTPGPAPVTRPPGIPPWTKAHGHNPANSPVASESDRPALPADVLKEKLAKVRTERQNREDKQPSLLAQRPQRSPGKEMILAKAANVPGVSYSKKGSGAGRDSGVASFVGGDLEDVSNNGDDDEVFVEGEVVWLDTPVPPSVDPIPLPLPVEWIKQEPGSPGGYLPTATASTPPHAQSTPPGLPVNLISPIRPTPTTDVLSQAIGQIASPGDEDMRTTRELERMLDTMDNRTEQIAQELAQLRQSPSHQVINVQVTNNTLNLLQQQFHLYIIVELYEEYQWCEN